jgi:anthranilate phosphoribosyltransferase
MSFLDYLHRVLDGERLDAGSARAAMTAVLGGEVSDAQLGAFLGALRVRGETAEEIRGFAEAMRASAVKVDVGLGGRPLVDTCGTGGDGSGTFNISTVVAFVVAGAGVAVAKHGNRSMSSRSGSADVLEALGARVALGAEDVAASIREVGIGFLFAPLFHPAMRHAQPARAALKARTAFNLLGPLVNPARVTAELVGAPGEREARLMAEALAGMGLERCYVVHGADGLDEVSTTGPTLAFEVREGSVAEQRVAPADFGVETARLADLQGGGAAENAAIARAVLEGEKGPRRDIVAVNAAMALMAAGAAESCRDGMRLAAESIDSRAARAKLAAFVEFSRSRSTD